MGLSCCFVLILSYLSHPPISTGPVLSQVASYLSHYDAEHYPDPEVFRPERWLEADGPAARGSALESMGDDLWFPFSKGRFSCR